MGNTFDVNTVKYGHARKVWREIRHRYPGGGMVSNISYWVAVGKIPAGTAVKFDLSGKTFTAYTDARIKAAESDITTLRHRLLSHWPLCCHWLQEYLLANNH
jgi:hypothetical protein